MMDQDPGFRDYLAVVSKWRRWIIVLVVLSLGAASALTYTAQPIFEAEAKLFVGQRQVNAADVDEARNLTELSFRLLQSYAAVLKTHPIARLAVREGRLPHDPVELANDLDADPILDTQLIRLRYRSTDPELAQRTVNSVAGAFVDEIQKIDASPEDSTAIDEPAVKVSVVEPALRPREAVSPNPIVNLSLGLLVGLLLGMGFALLAEHFDNTIKDKEDAERSANAAVLAAIPKTRNRSRDIDIVDDGGSMLSEMYRKLRTAIHLNGSEAPAQVILVTSPSAQDGKTTIATNLAAVHAYGGIPTLLLEADMRRPILHKLFRPDGMTGLVTVLLETVRVSDAVLTTRIPGLYCLPAAGIPSNPVELLSSPEMGDLLMQLRQQFEIIVIDAPPILPVADTINLASRVDGVLLVARAKETYRDRLGEAVDQVRKAGGSLLGIVLNAVPADKSEANDYSYYGAHR